MISSWFVGDLLINQPDAKVKHVIQAIGSSSLTKGRDFITKHCPGLFPAVYGSYEEVYTDPNVDVVYIGTPHAFHKKNCLGAIQAGKAVFCEKAFTLNANEAREVFTAAKAKGVYVAEAMWLRHRPLVHEVRRLVHEEKTIGDVLRVFSDFGQNKDISNLPETSRFKQLSLGAGSLLDLGIYSLTWAILGLESRISPPSEKPNILATQTHVDGIEVTSSVLLTYPSNGRQGIITSTTMANGNPDMLARIQGTRGCIEVYGPFPSDPYSFTVYPAFQDKNENGVIARREGKVYNFPVIGRGYAWEAENAAMDILNGKTESDFVPWAETIRVMEMLDEIRRQGGTVYPQDDSD